MKSYWQIILLIHRCVWQDWKHGRGQIGKVTPKYKAEPADETPVIAELPSFGVCKIQDECLVIPHELRSQYLSDPSRNHEWRKLLKEFDHKWGESVQTPNRSTTPAASPSGSTAPTPGSEPGPSPRCLDGDLNGAAFDWASVFPDSPTTRTDMETKFPTGRHQFTMDGNLVGVIIEGTETTGPQLYIMATGDGSVETDTPVLTFGAGTWLLDGKAENFIQDRCFNERSKNISIWFKQNLCFGTSTFPENTHHQISITLPSQENPTKGYLFHLESDADTVVLEDASGSDGNPASLRSVLQDIERGGLVDFELAGHVVQRPGEVWQSGTDRCGVGGRSIIIYNSLVTQTPHLAWKYMFLKQWIYHTIIHITTIQVSKYLHTQKISLLNQIHCNDSLWLDPVGLMWIRRKERSCYGRTRQFNSGMWNTAM